jgi:peptidoglycan-associated lipoprotein
LALKRAENVRQVIIGYGATDKQVVVKSLGESKPKLKGRDEESWAENRRSDVVYEREE